MTQLLESLKSLLPWTQGETSTLTARQPGSETPGWTGEGKNPAGAAAVGAHWALDQGPMMRPLGPLRDPEPELVYLGINAASRDAESAALIENVANVTTITGQYDLAMEGCAMSLDGETEIDLTTEDGIRQFLDERGIAAVRPDEAPEEAEQRVETLVELFSAGEDDEGRHLGLDPMMADEMAELMEVLQGVESGERAMDRLVISGHSWGSGFFGEGNGMLPMQHLQMIMDQFPNAQDGVEDLKLSACHSLENFRGKPGEQDWNGSPVGPVDNSRGEVWRDLFPSLQTVSGFGRKSPTGEQGADGDIVRWAKTGGDEDKLAALARQQRKEGSSAKMLSFDDE